MKPKAEVIVKTTIRVPKPLWDKTRIKAIEQGISVQELIIRALEQYLTKGGK